MKPLSGHAPYSAALGWDAVVALRVPPACCIMQIRCSWSSTRPACAAADLNSASCLPTGCWLPVPAQWGRLALIIPGRREDAEVAGIEG